ncbi:MAG: RHS repeat-associated core domain-containing protein [Candidatus Binataceae bacterium]
MHAFRRIHKAPDMSSIVPVLVGRKRTANFSIIAITACAVVLVLLIGGTAHAQTCLQNCANQYEDCLGNEFPGLGGIAVCLGILHNCEFSCTDFPEPDPSSPSESGDTGGDPVHSGKGFYSYNSIDLSLPDVIPIGLIRTYRQQDSSSQAFGIGMENGYDLAVFVDTSGQYTYVDLVLPDGARARFARTSPGTGFANSVFQDLSTPGPYYGSTIAQINATWTLSLKRGGKMIFAAGSMLSEIQDQNGNVLEIRRDANNNVNTIVSPNGRWLYFTYDSSHRVTSVQDEGGRTVQYTYDNAGSLAGVIDVAGGTTSYAYDSSGRLATITTPDGNVHVSNQYDANGRVAQQTLVDGSTWQYAYTTDQNNNVTAADLTDPRGFTRHLTFDANGYVISDTRAVGKPEQQVVTFQRDPNTELMLSMTDPLGRQTSYTYDALGNMTGMTALAGTQQAITTTITYDPISNLMTGFTDPTGSAYSVSYDTNGNPAAVADPSGARVNLTYNPSGQLLTNTDAAGVLTTFGYSTQGDSIGATDSLGNTFQNFTDVLGRVVSMTDPAGSVTSLTYDSMSRPLQITDPLGNSTSFQYTLLGSLASLTDPRGGVYAFSYNNSNRLASEADPLNRAETYAYDAMGNVISQTDARGKITVYSYDGVNRRIFVGFGANNGSYESTITYTYDGADRITQVVDSQGGTITRTYDSLDDLTSEVTPLGTVSYTYDNLGRRLSMTVAGQPPVIYSYNRNSRLTSLTQGSTAVAIAYDSAGRRSTATLPDGIVATYTYDAASRLASLSYSLNGNPLGDLAYSYDSLGRIINTSGSFANTFVPQPVAANTYDLANQLNVSGATSFSYDANGNLLTDGTNTYIWDARNHLISISGTSAASFVYDAFGRRISKTVNGITTQYLYDGVNSLQEIQNGTSTANMLDDGLDQYFLRSDASGSWTYLTDALGSTIALADSSGTIQTQYTYDPFGNVKGTGATSNNPYQYTGRENDGTGLYYYRARYYSPTLARFISTDPAEQLSSAYAYAEDSPVMFDDPSGATSVPNTDLVNTIGNIIFNETSVISPKTLAAFVGRTDVGVSLINGFFSYDEQMCIKGYVSLPNGGCVLPTIPRTSESIFEQSQEASELAFIEAFNGADLGGIQFYRVWPEGPHYNGIHSGGQVAPIAFWIGPVPAADAKRIATFEFYWNFSGGPPQRLLGMFTDICAGGGCSLMFGSDITQ